MFTCRNIHRNIVTITNVIVLTLISHAAHAAQIVIQTGDPQLPGVVTSTWRNEAGDAAHNFTIPAQSSMSAADLATATMQSLMSVPGIDPASIALAGDHVSVMSTPLLDPLDGVLPGGSIYWSTGTTAQERMMLSSPDVGHATIAATGFFQPNSQTLQPARFTAGIVTDVGELTATVSAQELNFQTDGPIICQALFQRLAPRAPQYGAQINYAGDRLEIYFDPAYTVTQGGIIFGTTSPSPGYSGTITTPPLPPVLLPGDYDNNGAVEAADYPIWRKNLGSTTPLPNDPIGGTIGPAQYDQWRSHFGDTAGNGRPLQASAVVPEPATLSLCSFAALAGLLRLSRRRQGNR